MNLDYATIKTTAIWVLVIIAVVAIVLAVVIKKIVGKIIALVLAAVLISVGWQQRSKVIGYAGSAAGKAGSDICRTHPTFIGIDVTFPGC